MKRMKKRVLIVEDVEFNRDLLVQLLEEDYEILTANDGGASLELAARERPPHLAVPRRTGALLEDYNQRACDT